MAATPPPAAPPAAAPPAPPPPAPLKVPKKEVPGKWRVKHQMLDQLKLTSCVLARNGPVFFLFFGGMLGFVSRTGCGKNPSSKSQFC